LISELHLQLLQLLFWKIQYFFQILEPFFGTNLIPVAKVDVFFSVPAQSGSYSLTIRQTFFQLLQNPVCTSFMAVIAAAEANEAISAPVYPSVIFDKTAMLVSFSIGII
jgi:hypothetical protein